MSRLSRLLVVALAFVAVSLFTVTASALPRFSISEGVPCVACHIDPSGGGMRNAYGRYVYGPTRLPLSFRGSSALQMPIRLDLGDTLAFGGDSRTAFINQRPQTGQELSSFFQMEANLYVAAKLFNGLTLYYDQEAYGSFQAMAIYQRELFHDVSVYVKGGRFAPTYGLRLENHNLWIRQDIGFGPTDKDQGLEIGAQAGPLLLQAAALNGSPPEQQLDENTTKAVVARAEVLGRIGPLRAMFGGSLYLNETGVRTDKDGVTVDSRSTQSRHGIFAGASLGRFTYMAEADIVHSDP